MPITDLHSHILPGFDDGASNDDEFLAMARAAVRGDTVRMAATPHYDLEKPALELDAVEAAVRERGDILRAEGIGLELVPGVEVRINAGLYRLAREGSGLERLTLGEGRKYLLCDLPLIDMPSATGDVLFQVQLCGIVPILAHPERNRYLAERTDAVRELRERGVEIQVNGGSLLGLYGKTARRSAFVLLDEGIARLVASDAHSPDGRGADLSGAARVIRERLGEGAERALLEANPERVLAGEPLLDAIPRPARRAPRSHRRLFARGRQR
ncbi:MAG: phosphotransferase [Actinomycetota bacterium]|nr:phosphotransferase [Actinomycetota bacterium]MDD5665873.1 phosphotransferase [Actinomycetota bacterium]